MVSFHAGTATSLLPLIYLNLNFANKLCRKKVSARNVREQIHRYKILVVKYKFTKFGMMYMVLRIWFLYWTLSFGLRRMFRIGSESDWLISFRIGSDSEWKKSCSVWIGFRMEKKIIGSARVDHSDPTQISTLSSIAIHRPRVTQQKGENCRRVSNPCTEHRPGAPAGLISLMRTD